MTLRTHQEEVFEGEGIQPQEMSPRGATCPGLRESLEIFFAGTDLEPLCEVRGMTVGHLVLALQRQLLRKMLSTSWTSLEEMSLLT